MATKKEEVEHWFMSPWNRHLIQFAGVCFFAGGLWYTTKADLGYAQQEIDDTKKTVSEIRSAINETKVEAARVRIQVERMQKDLDDLSKKLDTLLWRTSPYNPDSQYPAPKAKGAPNE